jgi:hypothetical protein
MGLITVCFCLGGFSFSAGCFSFFLIPLDCALLSVQRLHLIRLFHRFGHNGLFIFFSLDVCCGACERITKLLHGVFHSILDDTKGSDHII